MLRQLLSDLKGLLVVEHVLPEGSPLAGPRAEGGPLARPRAEGGPLARPGTEGRPLPQVRYLPRGRRRQSVAVLLLGGGGGLTRLQGAVGIALVALTLRDWSQFHIRLF